MFLINIEELINPNQKNKNLLNDIKYNINKNNNKYINLM